MPPLTRRALLKLPAAAALAGVPPGAVSVADHGAAGDGRTPDTGALQRAIDTAAAQGGGTVHLPAGVYLTGTLELRSRVTLHFDAGATLQGSPEVAAYRLPHLLYAQDAEDLAIQGDGTIDGSGQSFFDDSLRPLPGRPGPMIELVGCRNVRIESVRLRNAPSWTLHPKSCDGVRVRGVSIANPIEHRNTDGINPDSCRNVHISGCFIQAGDDCIALKTSHKLPWKPQGYGEPVAPCENVVVSDCVLVSAAAGLKLGTESFADVRDCRFANCVITDSSFGVAIFAKDGGTYSGISFSGLTIRTRPRRPRRPQEWALVIDLERRWRDSPLGAIRGISFSDVEIAGSGRVLVGGTAESPIRDLRLKDVRLRATGYGPLDGVSRPRGGRGHPLGPGEDTGALPAALIFSHLSRLDLEGLRVEWPDAAPARDRHAVLARDIDGLRIAGFEGRQAAPGGDLAALALERVRDAFITGCRAPAGTGTFLHLSATAADEVLLTGNDLRRAR